MSLTMSGVVTGAAQNGFTTPTYTLSVDTPPGQNSIQSYVSAIGGTQSGVAAHTVSNPFTISVFKPVRYAEAPQLVNGVLRNVKFNTHKVKTRKGIKPVTGANPVVGEITTDIKIPAGADLADIASARAALSAHIGFLQSVSTDLGLLMTNGTM